MGILTEKRVLFVGDQSQTSSTLLEAAKDHGVSVIEAGCVEVTPEYIEENDIDLLILNHVTSEAVCDTVLRTLQSANLSKTIPIFAIVQDSAEAIQDALAKGAADYMTENEETDSVIQKMKAIFGVGDNFSSSSSIDITPERADISSTGIKVYIVEDDPLLRNLLAVRFEKSSFPHEFSTDGKNAIPAITQFKPDIIVLDIMLPGMSGLDLMEQIKSTEELKSIPVLIFSNRDSHEDRQRANELGAAGFYVKAMTDLSEIVETIESIVNGT